MPLKITFNTNGTWQGGAQIPPELRDISNLHEWISSFLKKFKLLGKMYAQYFTNDGELVGQEKANLVIALDELIGGLALLRKYVTKDTPNRFETLDNKYGYWYEIKLDRATWRGRGKMSNRYTFKISSFANWYSNTIMPKIQATFRLYSRAMADGVLTDDESKSLCKFIEIIIFDILVIEKVLIGTDMNH
ncbi:MAG: hypothetical protein JXJ04_21180 [Spirochaetales bacterium]|nr:hypothetical protein [Spirochaetales bacterium]